MCRLCKIIRTYKEVIDGQEVTVKVYSSVKDRALEFDSVSDQVIFNGVCFYDKHYDKFGLTDQ